MTKYRLTMTPEQARLVSYACELYMRLKLGQYEELPFALIDLGNRDFAEKRDKARGYLKDGFDAMLSDRPLTEIKDEKWHRLYNIHQVVRHAIWQEEFPGTDGVWSYAPMDMGGVGLPEIEIVKDGNE